MTKYQHQPGRGSIFPNDRKEKDSHPDMKGTAKLPDGTDVWISGWRKEGDRGEWISLSFDVVEEHKKGQAPRQERSKAVPAPAASYDKPFNDDVPF